MSKIENNWLSKSLDELEKGYWPETADQTRLVKTCSSLRKKQFKEFEIEDLRIMISQNIGLKYLIPLAIESLAKNILAEGDFYEGDLLKSVLTSDLEYWKENIVDWKKVCELYEQNLESIKNVAFESNAIRQIIKKFKIFSQIN